MNRSLLAPLGLVLVLVGLVWTAQGLGWLEGSPMTDEPFWAIAGPVVAGFGIALLVVALQRR